MTATTPVPASGTPRVRSALPGAGYALGVLTFINLLNYLDRYLVAGVLPRIEESLHIDHAQAGTLQSVFIVVYMLVAPLGGYFGDRYPRRWVLAVSILVWSCATLGAGLAGTYLALPVTRAIVGVGEAGYGTVSPGLIADFYPFQQRTRALSIFYVAIPVGSALGYVVGGWIGNTWSWHAAFFVGGLPGLWPRSSRPDARAGPGSERGRRSLRRDQDAVPRRTAGPALQRLLLGERGRTDPDDLLHRWAGGVHAHLPGAGRGVPPKQAAIVFGALLCVPAW